MRLRTRTARACGALVALSALVGPSAADDADVTTVVSYPVACVDGTWKGLVCRNGWYLAMSRNQYEVSVAMQHVVGHPYQVATPEVKFKSCAVLDARNWSCVKEDGSGLVVFRDGIEVTQMALAPPDKINVGTTRAHWERAKAECGDGKCKPWPLDARLAGDWKSFQKAQAVPSLQGFMDDLKPAK